MMGEGWAGEGRRRVDGMRMTKWVESRPTQGAGTGNKRQSTDKHTYTHARTPTQTRTHIHTPRTHARTQKHRHMHGEHAHTCPRTPKAHTQGHTAAHDAAHAGVGGTLERRVVVLEAGALIHILAHVATVSLLQ